MKRIKKYIQDYFEHERILLECSKIQKNNCKRSVAKVCLNTLWGKFAQRDNLRKTVVIKSRDELLKYLRDPQIDIGSILPVNENNLYLSYVHIDECIEQGTNTNVVIAAYTTAYACLELYKC